MKPITSPAVALLVLVTLATGAMAAGKNLPISAFFGKFSGGGVAQNRDSIYFAVTARDFDVTIRPAAGGGFRVDWISVIRRGGAPEKPDIRRKASTKTLAPGVRPGSFRGTKSGDPLSGKELCWARIHGNTLTVYLMTVDGDGSYVLQQYDRTLIGTGMKLVFKSLSDGKKLRTVTGRLAKIGN